MKDNRIQFQRSLIDTEEKAIERLVLTYDLVDGIIDLIRSEDNIINKIIRIVEAE